MTVTRGWNRSVATTSCAVMLVIGLAFLAGQARLTAQDAAPTPARTTWEYRTANLELSTLQSELINMGREGWEVVTILHTDQSVDSQADGRAHLLSGRVEVIAKRPLAN